MRLFYTIFSICISFIVIGQDNLELAIQTGHSNKVNGLIINEKRNEIISAGADAKIVFWDIASGKQIDEIITHNHDITALSLYQDSLIISSSNDKTLKIWSIQTKKLVNTIGPFEYPIKSIAVHPNNNQIVVGTRKLHIIDSAFSIITLKTLSHEYYDAVHIMEGSNYIVYGGKKDKYTYVIESKTYDIIKSIRINANAIDSKENELLIAGVQGELFYYDFKKEKEKKYALHSGVIRINDAKLGDEKIIFSRSDGIVECINKENFTTIDYFKGHLSQPTKVQYAIDNQYFVSADVDGNILRWDLQNNSLSQVYSSLASPINHCSFSENGEEMLVGYSNGVIRKINLLTNIVVSNRIYFNDEIRRKGWQYTILSFQKQSESQVTFQALKTKQLEDNPKVLSICEIWEGVWNLEDNKIELVKEIRKKETQNLIKELSFGKDINWKTYFLEKSFSYSIDNERELLYNNDTRQIELYENLKLSNKTASKHNDFVSGLAYNPIFDLGITYSWDGSIQFFDLKELKMLPKLYLIGQRDFIWINSDSYYYSSKGALNAVAFNWDNSILPYDQFDIKFNRPDFIYAELPFIDKEFIQDLKNAYYKRLKKSGINSIEEINITNELPVVNLHTLPKNRFTTRNVALTFDAHDEKYQITTIDVLINGVPQNEIEVEFTPNKVLTDISFTITLTPGENFIELIAINSENKKSLKQTTTLTFDAPKQKPNLYIAAIGVSKYFDNKFDLSFASKDAKDIVENLTNKKIYNQIHEMVLRDSNATFKNIKSIRSFIQPAQPNDVVIIFAAGHGVLDQDFNYYFAASDMNFSDPEQNGIPYEWFDETMLYTSSRKKLLILDACHSGEIDKEEVQISGEEVSSEENINFRVAGTAIENKNSEDISAFQLSRMLFADTRKSNGSTVISSASGTEYAIEGKKWNNGVFTYALLEGIQSKNADLNRDGVILISEIQTYVNSKVYKLTNGQQSPNARVENLKSNFRIW